MIIIALVFVGRSETGPLGLSVSFDVETCPLRTSRSLPPPTNVVDGKGEVAFSKMYM